ncbi:MAG: 30S ribosome-binding factor RbfA [Desulfobacterales bacterium]|jgi:ribosome-binding factor A|nr:30S ribosome-binding factor RbfA [Desulfobacterales bacterium]
MKPFNRADRVGALIQETLSVLLKKSIKDPRLQAATITGVKMSADLKLARIYFVISDRVATQAEALEGFQKAKGFIKYTLAQQLNMRYMPELIFYYDKSLDHGFHIDSILKKLEQKHAQHHQPPEKEQ